MFGNICPLNAPGNLPRYPLVTAEVDRGSGRLIRASVTPVADRRPGMPERMEFSNFHVCEDRVTDELVVDVPHHGPNREGSSVYTADLFRYRVRV